MTFVTCNDYKLNYKHKKYRVNYKKCKANIY